MSANNYYRGYNQKVEQSNSSGGGNSSFYSSRRIVALVTTLLALIGAIIVMASFFAVVARLPNANNDPAQAQANNFIIQALSPVIICWILGLLSSVLGLFLTLKSKFLNAIFYSLAMLGLVFAGCTIYLSGATMNACTNSFYYSNNSTDCNIYNSMFTGSFFYIIGTFIYVLVHHV